MGATLEIVKNKCRYRPVGGHVFVRVVKRERRTPILMPESMESTAQLWEGLVVMVGPGRLRQNAQSNEDRISPNCKVGDRVVFTRHSCINIDDDAPDIFLVGEDNIIAVRMEHE